MPFLFACAAILFNSCIKDDFEFDKIKSGGWSPELAVPLVNTSMTFRDMLARNTDIQVEIGADQFCTYMYSDTLYRLKAGEILQVKDQDVKFDFKMDQNQISLFNGQGSYSYSMEQHVTFNPDKQAELDSLLIKSGQLSLDLFSTFRQQASIRITMPGLRKNGQAFTRKFNLDYQGTLPIETKLNLDLKGYVLDATNNGSAVNDLTAVYKIELKNSGNPVTITDMLTVDGHFKNIKFNAFYGYVGQLDFSQLSDTLSFNFFNSQPGMGSFTLADPRLMVSISNSIGIPVRATIPSLSAFSQASGLYPVNSGIPNPLPVNSPLISQAGQQLTGSFQLNNSNSNLQAVISHLPEYFIYQTGMLTNPDGKVSRNFLTDSSSLSIMAGLELPLYGSAKDFIISDTTDFKLENLDLIESMELKATFTNGFPIDVAVQVYFADEHLQVLDSMITSGTSILESGTVELFSGKVTVPAARTTFILIDQDRMNRIRNARKVITMGHAATTGNGMTAVKIYADYSLGVRVGVKARLTIH